MRRPACVASLLMATAIVTPLWGQEPALTVTPVDGAERAIGEHTKASLMFFRVANTGTKTERVRLACLSAGQVVACSVFPRVFVLGVGQTVDVTVAVGVAAYGSGSVELIAENGQGISAASKANVNITTPSIVDVRPDGDIVTPSQSGRPVEFTVANVGKGTVALVLACAGQGVAECDGLDLSEMVLEPGAIRSVHARYSLNGIGIGTIVLSARARGTDAPLLDLGGININACNGRCQ